jgi:sugar O-acyltransferase (sialic acid O-acetyltransferase NeuD family)
LKRVVIYGAGQLGAMVAEVLSQGQDMQAEGFVDDDPERHGKRLAGLPVLGGASVLPDLFREGVSSAIVSIGSNRVRSRLAAHLAQIGFELSNAIDPTAKIAPSARLGRGVMIMAGGLVCSNAVIGNCVYIGPGAIVSHDVLVGDYVLLGAGSVLAGRATIERGAFVGAGATVVPARAQPALRLTVGQNAVVGAGAAVIRDVPPNAVVVGVPARIVTFRDDSESPLVGRNSRSG